MRPNLAITTMLAIMIIFCLAAPVSALYFDFEYFETDQMTYEVGETINMVAKMTASFDEDGWCYVSFAVVTDHGPVFDDTYYIDSSPAARYFSSSYTIMPEDTSPFPDPIVAYVIFNTEVFDKYSQGVNENIQVNITRGRVEVRPLSSLSIEASSNTTLSLSAASRYNESVPYANNQVSIEIYDSESALVFQNISTTDTQGHILLHWDSIPFSPGTYTIQVSGNDTSAFHAFSDSLAMHIEPEISNINVITATEVLYCQTPSGMDFDYANIIIEHVDKNSNPIDSSIVEWETTFGAGIMNPQGSGVYSTSIPFMTSPGTYWVNFTTFNTQYQNASNQILVDALPRNLNATIIYEQPLNSNCILIDIMVQDLETDELVESIPIGMNLTLGSWSFSASEFSNISGIASFIVDIPSTEWGIAEVCANITATLYYNEIQKSSNIEVCYIPQITSQIVVNPARGEYALINLTIQNPLDIPSSGLEASLWDHQENFITSGFTDSNGLVCLSWLVPSDISVGSYNYTIHIEENTQFSQPITIPYQVVIHYPLWLTSTNTTWEFVRGNLSEVGILLTSENGLSQSVGILLNDSMGEFVAYEIISLGVLTNITINIPTSVTIGSHLVMISILDANFALMNSEFIDTIVLTTITSTIANLTAFYQETLEFDVTAIDDKLQEFEYVNLRVYQYGNDTPFAYLESVAINASLTIPIPLGLSPGPQQIIVEMYGDWSVHVIKKLTIVVMIRISMAISISTEYGGSMMPQSDSFAFTTLCHEIAPSISSGVISRPPPILFNGTTSTDESTTRDTSPIICPRFNSGTSNLSTVCEKVFSSLSGNGQRVRSLIDLKDDLLSIIASSTDLDVLPKETIPHSALSGPDIITSERRSIFE